MSKSKENPDLHEPVKVKNYYGEILRHPLTRITLEPRHEIKLTFISEKAVLKKTFEVNTKDKIPETITYNEKTFKVNAKNIFRNFAFSLPEKIRRHILKLKNQYVISYYLDGTELKPVELRNPDKINGYTLYTATHANVYGRAISELIHNILGDKGKYIIYAVALVFIVVGIVVAYPYLVHHTVSNLPSNATLPTPTLSPFVGGT